MTEQILICYDGSSEAKRAVDTAAALLAPPHAVALTVWKRIIDVADELDAEVVVIGSRGLIGIREFARGSVAHDVATHEQRPVLIVPPVKT